VPPPDGGLHAVRWRLGCQRRNHGRERVLL
jgi:hypothetical protein